MSNPVLVIADWRARYSMYNNVSDLVLNNLWIEAIIFGKPIISKIINNQLHYYYIMLAHLTELEIREANGVSSSGLQGSVTVKLEIDKSNIYLWYNQTQWGAKIAQLMKRFGGFRFIR